MKKKVKFSLKLHKIVVLQFLLYKQPVHKQLVLGNEFVE